MFPAKNVNFFEVVDDAQQQAPNIQCTLPSTTIVMNFDILTEE